MAHHDSIGTYSLLLASVLLPATAWSQASAECEPDRLLSPPTWRSTDFGLTVAMTDGRVIVGDSRGSDGLASGVVHIYALDDRMWTLEQSIRPADAQFGDGFGFHVTTDGERIIVGAIRADLVGGIAAGAAYVFDFDGTRWVETGRLVPPEPIAWSSFGSRVTIDGGLAVVNQNETLYVFEETADGWQWVDRIQASDRTGERQGFGTPVYLTPDWLFVGAPFDHVIEQNMGAVYVYRRNGTDLAFMQKLVPTDRGIRPRLGYTLAFDGTSVFAAGPIADGDEESQGIVYRYTLDDNQWTLAQEITSDPPVRRADFGRGLAVRDGVLVIGASDEDREPLHQGAAYVFREQPNGDWAQVARIGAVEDAYLYGYAVATDGRHATIGAPFQYDPVEVRTIGAAYIADLSCLTCPPDLDADGRLTLFDFLTFFNAFDAGDPRADLDGDGELTLFDFLAFQDAFDAGC
ncbi:MAG: FG-GAP repeat protein [Phycisphaerales bacterium]|nr:FG-GAP repeat protein [Phycisphaerales bacterium]